MSIGKVLSELIKKFNLNVLELERMTGVPASTLYRLLKNKDGNPTIEVVKKISSFFQITVSQLIGEEPIGCRHLPLVHTLDVLDFFKLTQDEKYKLKTIPIEFPVSNKCFATFSQDNMMEPFILLNSIIIVDPEREISNKDFVFLIKSKQESPIIRQIIKDGDELYLKALNVNFPVDFVKMHEEDYVFTGVVVHYRTNLFDFNRMGLIGSFNDFMNYTNKTV